MIDAAGTESHSPIAVPTAAPPQPPSAASQPARQPRRLAAESSIAAASDVAVRTEECVAESGAASSTSHIAACAM